MRIVALACAHCGAPLQIGPRINRLACGHCGSAMHVEREGGTVSLHLDAITAIREGSVQTAAELALVRLEKERRATAGQISQLTGQVSVLSAQYVEADLLSDRDLALAAQRAQSLTASIEGARPLGYLAMIVAGIAVIMGCVWIWKSAHGFFQVVGALLLIGVGGFWGLVIALGGSYHAACGRLEESLKTLESRVERHRQAKAANAALTENRERLIAAQEALDGIEDSLRNYRNIVDSSSL